MVSIGLTIGADAGRAHGQAGFALALVVDTVLGGVVAAVVAHAAVLRIGRDVDAAAAAIERAVRTLADATVALGAAGADGVAVTAMLIVAACVVATVVAALVELRVEQVWIADALTVLA